MNVLALTILISVCLAAIFIVCFVAEHRRPRSRGLEQQALMPLDDPTPVNPEQPTQTHKKL